MFSNVVSLNHAFKSACPSLKDTKKTLTSALAFRQTQHAHIQVGFKKSRVARVDTRTHAHTYIHTYAHMYIHTVLDLHSEEKKILA